MSYTKTPSNGIKTKCDSQWSKQSLNNVEATIKLAGEEAKDRLYEPKHKKKLVRVLTVIAYVFFVSLAAIMLSLYYVFLWNGDPKIASKHSNQNQIQPLCNNIIAEMQKQSYGNEVENLVFADDDIYTPVTTEESTIWPDGKEASSEDEDYKKDTFQKLLLLNYEEND